MRYRRLSERYAVGISRTATWTFASRRTEISGLGFGRTRWRPDADVCETADTIDVVVDLAGVDEDAIEVQLFDDALVVEGERQLPACDAGAVYHAAAVLQGPFRLELPLPMPVDPSGVEARYERGLLRIRIPKGGVAGR
jgi:HSP20 family protein